MYTILANIVAGAPRWMIVAAPAAAFAAVLVFWSYRSARRRGPWQFAAGGLKWLGIAIMSVCLVEPLVNTTRPRPGSNLFLVLADNSRSLQLTDQGSRESRGEKIREALGDQVDWLA